MTVAFAALLVRSFAGSAGVSDTEASDVRWALSATTNVVDGDGTATAGARSVPVVATGVAGARGGSSSPPTDAAIVGAWAGYPADGVPSGGRRENEVGRVPLERRRSLAWVAVLVSVFGSMTVFTSTPLVDRVTFTAIAGGVTAHPMLHYSDDDFGGGLPDDRRSRVLLVAAGVVTSAVVVLAAVLGSP